MMVDCVDLKTETRIWRRSKAAARAAILERRVVLNKRTVTHTNTSVVAKAGMYLLEVWNTHDNSWDKLIFSYDDEE